MAPKTLVPITEPRFTIFSFPSNSNYLLITIQILACLAPRDRAAMSCTGCYVFYSREAAATPASPASASVSSAAAGNH